MGEGEGREGDWECGSCANRNYAFRSLCNRCKQPRILVDNKTPADSKWLPRIGDWICSGCSNNNYASREKCKKCGEPKEVAAMPMPMPGASLPTYTHYFSRAQGAAAAAADVKMNMMGIEANSGNSTWFVDKYGHQLGPNWSSNSGFCYVNNSTLMNTNEWRSGDWICNCGFHNYKSRVECKKCNGPIPPGCASHTVKTNITGLFPCQGGTKRLASEEFHSEWENKRLNAGDHFLTNQQHSWQPYPPPMPPTLLGKGAKQWRDGDWMCTNCNNHNYASRSHCNRCKTEKEVVPNQSVSIVA